MKKIINLCLALMLAISPLAAQKIWTADEANAWYKKQPWLVGCNFIPSTAVNELEMWQAETVDTKTIDKELAWAQSLGFNVVLSSKSPKASGRVASLLVSRMAR